jgi:hypothetical protein
MSDNYRHRRESAAVRHFAVESASVINIGDLVWLDTDDVKPASATAWNTNLATTQRDFIAKFIGMSNDRSRAGDTEMVGVHKSGVKEFECAAATFEIGDLVGPAKQSGNLLENQKVAAVATADLAIGKVAKRYASNTTRVEVEIFTVLDSMKADRDAATIIGLIDASGTHKTMTTAQDTKLNNINLGATNATDNEIIALLAAATSKLTADSVIDGATNKAYTGVEKTKLGNINLGATNATDNEIIALLAAAVSKLTADSVIDGTNNKVLTNAKDTKLAAIPEFQELTHEFDLAVNRVWAAAIPEGSVITHLRYINETVIGETGAASYKIELTGGTITDLETGIAFTKNTKATLGAVGQLCAGATAVELTPNAGTLDSGTVRVGITVRKPKVNYPDAP